MAGEEKFERASRILTQVFIGLAVFALFGTIVSKAFSVDPGMIAPIITVLLILCGSSVIAIGIRDKLSILLLLLICGGAEIVGVLTGLPFGRYEYTDRWWPTVPIGQGQHFPVLVPFAWLLTLGGSYLVIRTRVDRWLAVPLCAVLTTLIDLPMERAMTDVFHYWKWAQPGPLFGAPISNSAGWFVVSLIAGTALASRDNVSVNHNAWKVPAVFCVFVASCGGVSGADPAWVVLLGLGLLTIFITKPLARS